MTQQLERCCVNDSDYGDVIVQAVVALSAAQTREEVQGVVKSAARQLAGADGAAFVFSEGNHCFYADEDAITPLWKGLRFSKDECISGWAMNNRSQVIISDIYKDERIPHDAYRATFVKSLVMTPVRRKDPIAAIGAYWAHHHTTSAKQAQALQALADVTAVAVQNLEHRQKLEQLVQDRTLELSASRDELQKLAYVVSHELQEPLRSMSSNLKLLNVRYQNRLGDDANTFIASALANGTRTERMLDALWMYARADKAKTALVDVTPVDSLNRALNRLSDLIELRAAQISNASLPTVKAHSAQFDYLLQELVENAIKFSVEAPRIHISVQRKDGGVVFAIEDNGIGFDMIDGNAIFNMFHRLDKTKPGTGMGLAVCKRIVEAHGGSIWAQSRLREGTTFYFSLPG